MDTKCLFWILFGLATTNTINAAKILAITPIAGASHWNVMSSILEVLLNRGHSITVVTPFLRKIPHENYTEIDMSKLIPFAIASPWETVVGVYKPPVKCLQFLNDVQLNTCRTAFDHPDLQRVLHTGHYDLVITELLGSRCDLYLASHLSVPHVAIVSSQMLTWYQDSFDNPSNPSYITTLNSPYPKPETFVQRLWNLIDYVTVCVYFKHIDTAATVMGRKYFGDNRPHAEDLLRNVSMVFLNTHSNFDLSKPLATNFKEIGGIHLKPPNPLPTDLEEFINNSEHGVIYFSLGSVVRMKDLPISIQFGLKEGFGELPQKVLWKLESDWPIIDLPENVMSRKWFPQYDIIRHPNVKLFITHGGNSGVIEATSAGIPVLGFPIFFDQPRNLELFEHWGSGLFVDFNNFTKEDFVYKIKRILNDQRFKENAVKLSRRFHDRPLNPKDTVAYWTEYVLRHNGAHHLKSQAINTKWYQYFSLDLFFIAFVIITSVLYFFYNVISIVLK
ncbi:UDP-glucuronosyltransferase 1-7-like isoform X1 [Rhopalosiphum maidis]|uniref:UDP-glucuronosyltransferase 1-7-like isoform X1 n=1 Tax=Rhopalosiphum maidis TaxID=43146 RepID=UPI000F00F8E4|nr:UDP-glucuronosyltransferase 1-7-like isoform X1 [Rhopalosiphum maidis]XP_026808299.1 UDP-glucuronosyltransferase 1-7-like isoform X1 [Rhopalosiphum maidis]